MHGGSGECEARSRALDDFHAAEMEVLSNREIVRPVIGVHVGGELDIERVRPEADETNRHPVRLYSIMMGQHFRELDENMLHLVGSRVGTHAQGGMEPDLVATTQILELQIHELGVRNRHQGPVRSAYARRPETDLFHGAHAVPEATEIANPNRSIEEQRDPPEEIFE